MDPLNQLAIELAVWTAKLEQLENDMEQYSLTDRFNHLSTKTEDCSVNASQIQLSQRLQLLVILRDNIKNYIFGMYHYRN